MCVQGRGAAASPFAPPPHRVGGVAHRIGQPLEQQADLGRAQARRAVLDVLDWRLDHPQAGGGVQHQEVRHKLHTTPPPKQRVEAVAHVDARAPFRCVCVCVCVCVCARACTRARTMAAT